MCAVCGRWFCQRPECALAILERQMTRLIPRQADRFETNEAEQKDADPVNHPSHYADSKVETITAIEAWGLDFCLGNAVKYLSRAGKKDPAKTIEDLEKAIWYIKRRIAQLKGEV